MPQLFSGTLPLCCLPIQPNTSMRPFALVLLTRQNTGAFQGGQTQFIPARQCRPACTLALPSEGIACSFGKGFRMYPVPHIQHQAVLIVEGATSATHIQCSLPQGEVEVPNQLFKRRVMQGQEEDPPSSLTPTKTHAHTLTAGRGWETQAGVRARAVWGKGTERACSTCGKITLGRLMTSDSLASSEFPVPHAPFCSYEPCLSAAFQLGQRLP
jgi:hypothetical protein